MYLLTWNKEDRLLEATFGGYLCLKEAKVFGKDWHEQLKKLRGEEFSVLLDYATVSKLDDEVRPMIEAWREEALNTGACRIKFLARDDREAQAMAASRAEAVNSGREEYSAFGLVA